MRKKDIIINHSPFETRVAVLEGDNLTELHHDRPQEQGVVGNIYKGRVLTVLPGMGAAFVDIGLEKAAFLFVDDVVGLPSKENASIDLPPHASRNGHDLTNRADAKFSEQFRGSSVSSYEERQALIENMLKENQEIMVQVAKGPISTKGARITTQISLPGRNLVFMPTLQTVGVSRQIKQETERNRLRNTIERLCPDKNGFIIRTVAEGHTEEEFKTEITFLLSVWDTILNIYHQHKAPMLLHEDLRLSLRVLRDILSSEINTLLVDDALEFGRIEHFLRKFMPRYASLLQKYSKPQPIYDYYGIEEEIKRAMGNKVWLPSGGHLIIDHAEALTAIDVNTGRFVGSSNHEETILRTNLEAVKEVVYQLKLRNIGGIIIIDFIDMDAHRNRHRVYEALKYELRQDKARSRILQISEIGLVEMTRKRDSENLRQALTNDCPYCNGVGRIKSPSTVAFELFREIKRLRTHGRKLGPITVYLHPDVADYIFTECYIHLQNLERKSETTFQWHAQTSYHYEQFEIIEY